MRKNWVMVSFVKRFYIILLAIFFIQNELVIAQFNPKILKGQINLPLKKNQGFYANGLQYFQKDNQEYLILTYENPFSLFVYDLGPQELIKEIKLDREGPNGLGGDVKGVYTDDLESYYLYSYWKKILYKVDNDGRVIRKYDLESDYLSPVIDIGPMQPLLKIGDNLYLSGHLYQTFPKNELGKPIIKLNLKTGLPDQLGEYPQKTFDGNWAGTHITRISLLEFQEENHIVCSFDISDTLFILDRFGDLKAKVSVKSDHLDEIKPIHKDYDFIANSDKTKFYNYHLEGNYLGVINDPYRKLYYRFTVLGLSYNEFKKLTQPNFTVIVLDYNWKKLGEYKFNEGSYPLLSFVSKKGLFIANKSAYDFESDDFISFDLYKFK